MIGLGAGVGQDEIGRGTRRGVVLSLCVLLAIAYVITRSLGLDQSFWEDETYTATHYVAQGLGEVFNPDSYISNNHPLFNILAIGATKVISSREVALRLVSVIPSAIASLVMARWLWRTYGKVAGVSFTFLVVVSPMHFDEFRQARGWGLALLGATLVLVAYTRSFSSSFNYSLESLRVTQVNPDEFVRLSCNEEGPAAFVDYPRRIEEVDTTCLEARGIRVQLPQRKEPPITVWLIR